MFDLSGQTFGQYEITGRIGRGGMAVVYRARQQAVGREVAVKVIQTATIDPQEMAQFIQRFEREAKLIASLSHPHILKLFDFGQHGETVYLVMELLTGGSLAELIKSRRLDNEQAARLFEQIAEALDYAHSKGIVHRDLKPQNVLLDERGNAILTDFGISKVIGGTALTMSGVSMGTPAYMAPEMWSGQPLDARTDIYALGIMLYEMLTGRLPYQADTPMAIMGQHVNAAPPDVRALRPDLPAGVADVIRTAMAKRPDDRYQSAKELAAAFRIALTGAPAPRGSRPPAAQDAFAGDTAIVGAPVPTPEGGTRTQPTRRSASAPLLIGGIVLAAVIGLIAILAGNNAGGATTVQQTVVAQAPSPTTTEPPTPSETPEPVGVSITDV